MEEISDYLKNIYKPDGAIQCKAPDYKPALTKMYDAIKEIRDNVRKIRTSLCAIPQNESKEMRLSGKIFELDTKNTFVKVKADYFPIDKVLLSFVEFNTDTKKAIRSQDCCICMSEFAALCHDIQIGYFKKRIDDGSAKAKKEGKKYADPVYTFYGGTQKDGKIISRMVQIAPGNNAPVVITGIWGPGSKGQNGQIVPNYFKNGVQPEGRIRVAATYDMLKAMAAEYLAAHQAYVNTLYADKTSRMYYNPQKRNQGEA